MDALQMIPLTMCTMKAALAAGTTTTFSTTGTTLFCIKGKAYSQAVAANVATPTTDATTAAAFVALTAGYGCCFVFGYNSSGAVKVSQGPLQALNAAGNFILAPQFPIVPDTVAPFGYLIAKGGSTLVSTWTFGTNNLSGVTGMTYTFVDVMTLPDRPQVA